MAGQPLPSPSKTRGVTYFNHFPKFFLRPYGPADAEPENMSRRLSFSNCEWFQRPAVAMSEFAQTMISNYTLAKESDVLDKHFLKKTDKVKEFIEALKPFDTKSESEATPDPTLKDLHTVMSSLVNGEDNDFFNRCYSVGMSLFLMGIHYRTASHLMSNPDFFANISNNDERTDVPFKSNPTDEEMIRYVWTSCAKRGRRVVRDKQPKKDLGKVFEKMKTWDYDAACSSQKQTSSSRSSIDTPSTSKDFSGYGDPTTAESDEELEEAVRVSKKKRDKKQGKGGEQKKSRKSNPN